MKKICITVFSVVIVVGIIFTFRNKADKEGKSKRYDIVEDYVKKNITKIVDNQYKLETIKAISVIVRTRYMYEKILREERIEECWTNEASKVEQSNELNKKINKAVEDTKGEIMVYHNSIIYPFFHKVSSRITRNEDKILNIKINSRSNLSGSLLYSVGRIKLCMR